jgi:hypothetical protein
MWTHTGRTTRRRIPLMMHTASFGSQCRVFNTQSTVSSQAPRSGSRPIYGPRVVLLNIWLLQALRMLSNTGSRLLVLHSIILTFSGILSMITMRSGMVVSALHTAFSITTAILATTCPARRMRERVGGNWTKLKNRLNCMEA